MTDPWIATQWDWPELAGRVDRIARARRANLPLAVARGDMTQAEADRQIRVADALAAQWRAAAALDDVPELLATPRELLADVRDMVARMDAAHRARPSEQALDRLTLARALLWWQSLSPHCDTAPRILFSAAIERERTQTPISHRMAA